MFYTFDISRKRLVVVVAFKSKYLGHSAWLRKCEMAVPCFRIIYFVPQFTWCIFNIVSWYLLWFVSDFSFLKIIGRRPHFQQNYFFVFFVQFILAWLTLCCWAMATAWFRFMPIFNSSSIGCSLICRISFIDKEKP